MKSGSADATLLELILRFLKKTSSVASILMMHCFLMGIYFFRNDMAGAEIHAREVVQITFESKMCFPLISYYRYFASLLAPILSQYPDDFQDHCNKLFSQYQSNYTAFLSSLSESSVIAKLTDEDYPYIYGYLMGLSNSDIADKLGIVRATVRTRILKICKKIGVSNKRKLKEFLKNYM